MSPILLDWAWEGLLAILTVYLAALSVQWAIDSIFRRKIPLILGIVVACSIYTATTWTIYKDMDFPLASILPWMFVLIWSGAGFILLKNWHFYKSSPGIKLLSFIQPVGGLYLLFIILSVLFSFLIAGREFPVVVSGNNDIWNYSKLTNFVLDKLTGNNISGLDLFKSGVADDTPTAIVFLAGLSSLTGQPVFDVLAFGLLLVISCSAYIIKKLCSKIWQFGSHWAYLIAILWVTASFPYYLASNYFLAQWMGICLFLATILVLFSDEKRMAIQITTLCLFLYLIFMTYPPLFFPYMGVFLFFKAIEAVFSRKESGWSFSNSGLASVFLSVPLSLLLIFLLGPAHFKSMITHMVDLSSAAAGWPFGLVNPLVLTSLPLTQNIDDDTLLNKVVGYCILFSLIGYLTFRAYREKSLSPKQISMNILFASSLAVYFAYYTLKGASYQQWKFAGSAVLPLAFLPIVLVTGALKSKKRMGRITAHSLLIGLTTANIVIMIHHAINSGTALEKFDSLRELIRYDHDNLVKSITVDLKPHFQSTMIATQFVNKKPLTLLSASYFFSDKVGHFKEIPQDGILLTDGCGIFDPRNKIMLGRLFCIFHGPPQLSNEYLLRFNRTLPPLIKIKGLSARESKGRWNEGHKTVFLIPVRRKWKGVDLTIKGDPFLTKDLRRQRLSFSVQGVSLKEFFVSRETEMILHIDHKLFDDGYVALTIDLPDSASPSRDGSSDHRILGFYFLSLKVKAES